MAGWTRLNLPHIGSTPEGQVQFGMLERFANTITQWARGVDATLSGDVPAAIPTGFIGEVASTLVDIMPPGWFLLNGQTIVNAQTVYPDAWALLPTSFRSGSDFILPDIMSSGRVLMSVGTTSLGLLDGSNTVTLNSGHLPPHAHTLSAHTHSLNSHTHSLNAHTHDLVHTHTINHTHGAFTSGNASPAVTVDIPRTTTATGFGASGNYAIANATGTVSTGTLSQSATHTHSVTITAFSGTSGAASTDTTTGPSVTNTLGPSVASTLGPSTANTDDGPGTSSPLSIASARLRVNFFVFLGI